MFQKTAPKTTGIYRATISGYNELAGKNFQVHFVTIFNRHGLVYFREDDVKIHFTLEEMEEIHSITSYEHFTSLTAYLMDGNNIKFKYYDPESYAEYIAGVTNPEVYTELIGEFKYGNLYLKYFKAQFCDAYQDYTYEQAIPQTLCFSLHTN